MSKTEDTIRKFNRFELKYLLPLKHAERFKKAIESYLNVDSYGKNGEYAISSLYYDSPDNRFYWEKIEGIKFRRKLRIRHYESAKPLTPASPVFVEIKQRIDRVTQKRRVKLPYKDALLLCNEAKMPEKYDKIDESTLDEIQSMIFQYKLKPSIITSYFRHAYVGTDYDLGLRVTFDTNLRYRLTDLDLDSKKMGKFMLPPDIAIMEIKANECVPYWLTEMVGKHNIRLIRVSKFCHGLEVAKDLPQVEYVLT